MYRHYAQGGWDGGSSIPSIGVILFMFRSCTDTVLQEGGMAGPPYPSLELCFQSSTTALATSTTTTTTTATTVAPTLEAVVLIGGYYGTII